MANTEKRYVWFACTSAGTSITRYELLGETAASFIVSDHGTRKAIRKSDDWRTGFLSEQEACLCLRREAASRIEQLEKELVDWRRRHAAKITIDDGSKPWPTGPLILD